VGLGLSHGDFHLSYSSFNDFRSKVVEVSEYDLVSFDVEGSFGTKRTLRLADIDWESFADKNYQGEWDETPDDILLVFLVHSDCVKFILALMEAHNEGEDLIFC
jgi:hypothetical protein